MQWDSEIQDQIKKLGQRKRTGMIVLLLGILFPFSLFLLSLIDAWWETIVIIIVILVAIGIFTVGLLISAGATKKIKDLISTEYMPRALNKVFKNVEYEQDLHLPEEYLDPALVQNKWDDVRGNDYIKAEYREISIEFSDLSLTYDTYDSDNDRKTVSIFKGLWLVCDFKKEFPAELLLVRKKFKLFGNKPPRGMLAVSTGNAGLEKEFRVFSDYEEGAQSMLTPQAIERIMKLDSYTGSKSSLKFDSEGKIYIAVNSGRNFFEPGKNMKKVEEKIAGELRFVTDILDILHGLVGR